MEISLKGLCQFCIITIYVSLQVSISGGTELIEQGHFGAAKIQERIDEVSGRWSELIARMDARKKRLTDGVDFHQFFTDADDVDNWMLDVLRLVSPSHALLISLSLHFFPPFSFFP